MWCGNIWEPIVSLFKNDHNVKQPLIRKTKWPTDVLIHFCRFSLDAISPRERQMSPIRHAYMKAFHYLPGKQQRREHNKCTWFM
ncbi:hypothetical protein POVWA1_029020 [Plasmodium ovale wallikeri]|uniref:Uncharacterized protein n=1 Tax=Plasmodium ovale wallikeri TaxID=864142 RepID=A0A1A8YVN4_PLAOA|nr:hypothetical protein POVWA1_029020 [Plasmodium ovale wallikeri]